MSARLSIPIRAAMKRRPRMEAESPAESDNVITLPGRGEANGDIYREIDKVGPARNRHQSRICARSRMRRVISIPPSSWPAPSSPMR